MSDANSIPDWMNTPEMWQAMSTLVAASPERERNYYAHRARQDYLRQQLTIQNELEEYRREIEAVLQREQATLAEIERLKAVLEQSQGK